MSNLAILKKMEVSGIQFTSMEFDKKAVVTSALLAEFYQTAPKVLRNNFLRNKERFIEGKHYFIISGSELSDLRASLRGSQIDGKARSLTLWTEKGAARHAKMLNTEKAWEVFELLEDAYFQAKRLREMKAAARQANENWLASNADRKDSEKIKSSRVADVVKLAEKNGSQNANEYFQVYAKMINAIAAPNVFGALFLTSEDNQRICIANTVCDMAITEALEQDMEYHAIYYFTKDKIMEVAKLLGWPVELQEAA